MFWLKARVSITRCQTRQFPHAAAAGLVLGSESTQSHTWKKNKTNEQHCELQPRSSHESGSRRMREQYAIKSYSFMHEAETLRTDWFLLRRSRRKFMSSCCVGHTRGGHSVRDCWLSGGEVRECTTLAAAAAAVGLHVSWTLRQTFSRVLLIWGILLLNALWADSRVFYQSFFFIYWRFDYNYYTTLKPPIRMQ